MRVPWLASREPESALRQLALFPFTAASWCYAGGTILHRFMYERGMVGGTKLPGHVLSVGGMSAGGSGKTPVAAWLASALYDRGRRVALASRGYGRRSRESVTVVSDGRYVHSRAECAGDEPMVLVAHAPGVPVLVGRDRALVGLRAFSAFGSELLVLDDGFQHHRLKRSVDVVTVDSRQGFGNRRVLPRGPLREPIRTLRHADVIAVVDGPLHAEEERILDEYAPLAYRLNVRRRAANLRPLSGGDPMPPETLAVMKVGLLSGIARPDAFRATVEEQGAVVLAERQFSDHHRYTERDLFGLAREAAVWITTEKDAAKILPSWIQGAEVLVLTLDLEVDSQLPFLDWLESRLR